jgi:hypothetical protein
MTSTILAGIQRRNLTIGRIRSGDKDEKGRPHRLEGFRFTTSSELAACTIAELYQGQDPRPWGRQWEVYTPVRELGMALPPGDLVIRQAMMRWSGGGPSVVCDGVTTTRPTRGPCQCPQPDDPCDEESVWEAIRERRRLAAQKVPQGCYPYTWIKMVLADVPGIGVWQLLSKSEQAAAEIVDQAVMLERARAIGQLLAATLVLEYRESRVDGLLRQYNVPVLRVDESVRAIAAGELAGRPLAAQLPPRHGTGPLAIMAGRAADAPPPLDLSMVDDRVPLDAQMVADLAAGARTRGDIDALKERGRAHGIDPTDMICPDPARPDHYIVLRDYLAVLQKRLPEAVPGE